MSSVILLQFAQCLTNENILYHSYTPPGNVCGSVLKNRNNYRFEIISRDLSGIICKKCLVLPDDF